MVNNPTIIKLSKTKIVFLILGSIGFVLASVWILSFADTQTRYDPAFLKLVSYVSILLFSFCGIYGVVKVFDKKPGLIINDEGIIDNASAVNGGLIKWSEIIRLEEAQVQKTKFLLIFVHNPDDFLNGAKALKKQIMKMNAKMYGTPLSISSTALNCNFDDLVKQITNEWEKHRD